MEVEEVLNACCVLHPSLDIDEVACVLLRKREVAKMHHDSRRSDSLTLLLLLLL